MGADIADKDKQDARLALKVLLDKVSNRTASAADITAAKQLNDLFLGGEYNALIDAAQKTLEKQQEAQKVEVARNEGIINDPIAATNKFFATPGMQEVLDLHQKVANGEEPTAAEWSKTTKTILAQDKNNDSAKLLASIAAKKEAIKARLKINPEEFSKHHDAFTKLIEAEEKLKLVHAQKTTAQNMMQDRGIQPIESNVEKFMREHKEAFSDQTMQEFKQIKNQSQAEHLNYQQQRRAPAQHLATSNHPYTGQVPPRGIPGTSYIDPPRSTPDAHAGPSRSVPVAAR